MGKRGRCEGMCFDNCHFPISFDLVPSLQRGVGWYLIPHLVLGSWDVKSKKVFVHSKSHMEYSNDKVLSCTP